MDRCPASSPVPDVAEPSFLAGIEDVLPHLDVFLPSEEEAISISGADTLPEALEWLKTHTRLSVVSVGAGGAVAVCEHGEYRQSTLEIKPAEVVDTTGAGDAFNAGFLHGWLESASIEKGLVWGCALGASCISQVGGSSPADFARVEAIVEQLAQTNQNK